MEGDLFFQNTGTGTIDNAIKSVTATAASKNYSHVGMAMQKDGEWFVIEAIPKKGVCKTLLKDFLTRNKNSKNKSQTTVARLDKKYQKYIPKALEYGVLQLNKPYDSIFLWDDNAYYCSELIYKMFSFQSLEKKVLPFITNPMTFKDSSGNTATSWIKYYEKLKHNIPEGQTGTNPNLMASSPYINFIFDYSK